MAQVTLRQVIKKYDEVLAVRGVDLDIADKEFIVLVRPSGFGRSSALRMELLDHKLKSFLSGK